MPSLILVNIYISVRHLNSHFSWDLKKNIQLENNVSFSKDLNIQL